VTHDALRVGGRAVPDDGDVVGVRPVHVEADGGGLTGRDLQREVAHTRVLAQGERSVVRRPEQNGLSAARSDDADVVVVGSVVEVPERADVGIGRRTDLDDVVAGVELGGVQRGLHGRVDGARAGRLVDAVRVG
jgi:hypothetical protein